MPAACRLEMNTDQLQALARFVGGEPVFLHPNPEYPFGEERSALGRHRLYTAFNHEQKYGERSGFGDSWMGEGPIGDCRLELARILVDPTDPKEHARWYWEEGIGRA